MTYFFGFGVSFMSVYSYEDIDYYQSLNKSTNSSVHVVVCVSKRCILLKIGGCRYRGWVYIGRISDSCLYFHFYSSCKKNYNRL